MSAPQRKGCRGTLTRFRNPAAAPVLRWVIGEIRPVRASSVPQQMVRLKIRQISCRSVEFCRVAAGLISCTTLVRCTRNDSADWADRILQV